ncbi:hypothetical protein P4S72_20120 [Vibrio sp. PP-XX7]
MSVLLIALLLLSGYVGSELTLFQQWGIIAKLATSHFEPQTFAEILFTEAHLPRVIMALMTGESWD